MCRRERERRVQVGFRVRGTLPRQRVHEIEIEVREPGRVQLLGGAPRLVGRVNAAEQLQLAFVEALRAERHPRDAGRAVFAEAAALDGAGVRLERDFRIARQSRAAPRA